jgi:hypothetical protein
VSGLLRWRASWRNLRVACALVGGASYRGCIDAFSVALASDEKQKAAPSPERPFSLSAGGSRSLRAAVDELRKNAIALRNAQEVCRLLYREKGVERSGSLLRLLHRGPSKFLWMPRLCLNGSRTCCRNLSSQQGLSSRNSIALRDFPFDELLQLSLDVAVTAAS